MYDRISDVKLVKACDLLAAVPGALFSLLRLRTENICLRDDGQPDQRVLKSAARPSVDDRDLTGRKFQFLVLCVKCRHLLTVQIQSQTSGSGVGG